MDKFTQKYFQVISQNKMISEQEEYGAFSPDAYACAQAMSILLNEYFDADKSLAAQAVAALTKQQLNALYAVCSRHVNQLQDEGDCQQEIIDRQRELADMVAGAMK